MFATLPADLQSQIIPDSVVDLGLGALRNCLLLVATAANAPAFLKVGTGDAAAGIDKEVGRLRWVGRSVPSPEILHYSSEGGTSFLLLSAIDGVPSHEAIETIGAGCVVQVLADGLRRIHSGPIEGCPFDSVLEEELAESARRVAEGLIDETSFVAATGRRPSEHLAEVLSNSGVVRDLVFTHGDYALPNVITKDASLSGVLDWGTAGIADRHRDFMCIEMSIRRNCGREWIPRFYEAYGYSQVDTERIRFYSDLDQFDAHYVPRT